MSDTTIPDLLAELDDAHAAIDSRFKAMMEADDRALYGMDLLVAGALNRTRANLKAFDQLIKDRNLVIAGALLRLQIDSALRVSAAFLVEDPHDFSFRVLRGERIDLMTDRNGKRLSDRSLVKSLSDEYDWLERVYERTSGYIHLSGTHIHHSIENIQEDGRFQVKVSDIDQDLPEDLYVEIIQAFAESIHILLKYVDGWIDTKNNPEEVAKIKEAILAQHENS
ncbi:MAG: hypothetical protein JJ921_02145 [Pseudomonadales bacterium]|nr:hypothetical protein [Pseudomonadales bacterium]MBO7005042.1 hypothetical protein [Pseudomonadales bacterium]